MKILFYIILCVVLFVLYVRLLEKKSLFYPDKVITSTPEDINLGFEDVFIQTSDDVKIHGWFIPREGAKKTIIFYHGNAGNISGRLGKIFLFNKIGANVLIIDYRGFGKSEGKPTEQGMYLDAQAAYDYVKAREDINDSKIVIYGASLGGAAAVDLAKQRDIDGLIIDSSFSNAVDMAKTIYPFIPSFMVSIGLDNTAKIKDLTIPKLFFHSKEDMTVPYSLGRKLFDAAKEPKTFVDTCGGHNDECFEEGVFENGLVEFLESI